MNIIPSNLIGTGIIGMLWKMNIGAALAEQLKTIFKLKIRRVSWLKKEINYAMVGGKNTLY